jgi:hypothetical protein
MSSLTPIFPVYYTIYYVFVVGYCWATDLLRNCERAAKSTPYQKVNVNKHATSSTSSSRVKEHHNRDSMVSLIKLLHVFNEVNFDSSFFAIDSSFPCHSLQCLSLTFLSTPCIAFPCLPMPCHAIPCPTLPCHAMYYLSMPCHAMPCISLSCHAMPFNGMPCLTFPFLSFPCHAMPCISISFHAMP